MTRLRICAAAAALAVALTACTPSNVLLLPRADTYIELPEGHGVVVARVVDTDSDIPFEYITLASKDLNLAPEEKLIRIRSHSLTDGGTGFFIGVVPVDQYSLSDLYGATVVGEYIYRRLVNTDPSFGTFSVQPGRITNLGTLLYYPKPDGDGYSHLVVRMNTFDSAGRAIEMGFPALFDGIDSGAAELTWDDDDFDVDRFDTYLNIVQNPLIMDRSQQLAGETVILSRAGAMIRRRDSGEWTVDLVESDLPLTMIDRNDQGEEVVTGESGTLFWRTDPTAEWVPLKAPRPHADLVGVRVNNDRQVFVIDRSESEMHLYQRSLARDDEWRKTLVFTARSMWHSGSDATETLAADSSDEVRDDVEALSRDSVARIGDVFLTTERGRLFSLDTARGQAVEIEESPRADRIIIRNGDIMAASASEFGGFEYAWTDNLLGDWREMANQIDRCPGEAIRNERGTYCANGTRRKYRGVVFLDAPLRTADGSFFAVVRAAQDVYGQDITLLVSRDDGATWTVHDEFEDELGFCNRLIPGSSDGSLLIGCSGTTGRIYSYDIATAALTVVREPRVF